MRAKLSSQMILFLVAQAASTCFVIRNYLKFLSPSPIAGIAGVHSHAWLSGAAFMHARQVLCQLPLDSWVLHS